MAVMVSALLQFASLALLVAVLLLVVRKKVELPKFYRRQQFAGQRVGMK